MKWKWLLLLLVILVAAVAWRCFLFVDETQFVIVTQFGRPVATLTEPGLHFKQPYQSWLPIDRRVQIYNPRPAEFLTSEKKNIDLDVFVCWRVHEAQRFLETVSDLPGAAARIHDVVWSKLAAAVSRSSLESLVCIGAENHKLETLVEEVKQQCGQEAGDKYGIELVDVKVKRIGLPEQVRESVFERMRKERARIAEQYRSEGKEKASKIRAEADKQKMIILAEATRQAEIERGEAEAEATKVYSEAHQKDPRFYELMRTLDAYKKILDDKTTLLLSGDSELLKYLTRGTTAVEAPPATERK
jgi:modulator of FtsH protease HflC